MKRYTYLTAAVSSGALGFLVSLAMLRIILAADTAQSWPDGMMVNTIYWLGAGPLVLLEKMGITFEGDLVVAMILNPLLWAAAGVLLVWMIGKNKVRLERRMPNKTNGK